MNKFVLLCLTLPMLTACHSDVYGPQRARVYVPGGVVVETDGYHGGHQGGGRYHCPPGHAKKGWC